MRLKPSQSYLEATARQRLAGILDPGSFHELCGPAEKAVSPHLATFDLPPAFDDGVAVGDARLDGRPVAVAAQEGRFMGGAIGEVHSAKIAGLLKRARTRRPAAVLLLLDSGGVRLQEANAGEIGVAEIVRALFAARAAGIPVLGAVGGVCGAFGGAGIMAGACDALVVSEEARVGVSGPEVIETTQGVETFDARDRALVWRTYGGQQRARLGMATRLVENSMTAFRQALVELLDIKPDCSLEAMEAAHAALQRRRAEGAP